MFKEWHAYPRDWTLDHSGNRIQSRAPEDFWALAFALSKAGRTGIRKLSLETIRTPVLFAIGSGDKKNRVDPGAAAYRTLEDMKLSFAGRSCTGFPKKWGYGDTNVTVFVKKDHNFGPAREGKSTGSVVPDPERRRQQGREAQGLCDVRRSSRPRRIRP